MIGDMIAKVRIENGEGLVEDLYLGSYIWKEITAGEGYKLDTNTYPINLEYEGQSVKTVTAKTTVSEKVITGNFEIEKVITSGDEDSGVVEKEQGAEFMVVAKKYVDKYGTIEKAWEHRTEFTNKEYDYLTTNKNGYAKSKELAYGNFVIKQVKGQMDLEMVKDEWTFTVSRENQDTIKYIVNNKNKISAIEFKREKWREAIDQVMRVATSFDYLEICVFKPQHEELRKDILSTCSFMGIGVYFINPTNMKVSKVLKPQKNKNVWKIQKKSVIDYLGDKNQ